MSEIKKEIKYFDRIDEDGNKIQGYLIEEEHTLDDIARWLIEHDWDDEVMCYLNNREEL